jgi:hypothetical protein
MSHPLVAHCKQSNFEVYVGRPTKWGNPFEMGKDGSRAQVVAKYRQWIGTQANLLRDLHELRGKVLGCYCAPQACHADILAELANKGSFADGESYGQASLFGGA